MRKSAQAVGRLAMLAGTALVITTVGPRGAAAGGLPHGAAIAAHPTDSADVAATVARFHDAIARGDSATVLSLLAGDATILESGDLESVGEYRAHHLPADIAFSRAVKERRAPLRVQVRGDVAWAIGTGTSVGTFRGRPVDSAAAELMVLTRSVDGWRIAAIHWSSRKRSR